MAMLLLSKLELAVAGALAVAAWLLILWYGRRLKLRRAIAAVLELVRLEQWDEARQQLANALRQYPANADLLSLLSPIERGLRAQ